MDTPIRCSVCGGRAASTVTFVWSSNGGAEHGCDGKPIKLKEKIEAIDKENKSTTYNFFDGDISKNYKVFKVFVQVFEKSDGGASVKFTIEYEKINENVEAPYGFLEFFEKSAKDIDSHLLKA
ncbi:MLP-like protein 31 [Arachis hypogaea]|uniref:MLP-like protein 31 n=1 Tax=Arachis hypogaea TaxID=3818 RepID=UPI0007AEF519|nr:MLP-like protein 34 [Arachis hypogaea]